MESRYLVYGLASLLLVVAIVFMVVGVRRRIERGRPARFHFGIGLVDVIEGLTGKELSQKTQGRIFGAAVGLGLLALIIGLTLLLVRRGMFS